MQKYIVNDFPALTGSEKQIKWANDIRDDVYNALVSEMYKTEKGSRTEAINYITSTKDMQTWIKHVKDAFRDTDSDILKQRINDSIEALRIASDQYGRVRDLIEKETSARFWIDHRHKHPADPKWLTLKQKIIGY